MRKSLDEIGGMLERRKYETAPAAARARSKNRSPKSRRACPPRWPRRSPKASARSLPANSRTRARHSTTRSRSIRATRTPPRASRKWPPRAASCRRSPTRRTPRAPRTCPRRKSCSPTCSNAIPATPRPPKVWRASGSTISDNQFNAEMGAGLTALNAGRLAEARTHLDKARAMRPDNTEVSAALQRVVDTGSGRSVAELEQRAAQARERGTLDRVPGRLRRGAGARPLAAVRRKGRDDGGAARGTRHAIAGTHRQAGSPGRGERARARPSSCWRGPAALPKQGPVIRSQVSRLELLLPTFNQPVMLALESDNATEVAHPAGRVLRRLRTAPGRAQARQVHRDRQALRASATCAARSPFRPGSPNRPSSSAASNPSATPDMEPSLSLDSHIVLRTSQGESRYRRARGDRSGFGRHARGSHRRAVGGGRDAARHAARGRRPLAARRRGRGARQHQRRAGRAARAS